MHEHTGCPVSSHCGFCYLNTSCCRAACMPLLLCADTSRNHWNFHLAGNSGAWLLVRATWMTDIIQFNHGPQIDTKKRQQRKTPQQNSTNTCNIIQLLISWRSKLLEPGRSGWISPAAIAASTSCRRFTAAAAAAAMARYHGPRAFARQLMSPHCWFQMASWIQIFRFSLTKVLQ